MRQIELTFQKNIRDIGGLVGFEGKKVKSNRIFRGGFLDKISEEDAKILESLHLTDVIDLRSTHEYTNRPDYVIKGVTYHNIPPMEDNIKEEDKAMADANLLWFVDSDKTGFEHMLNTYVNLLTSDLGVGAYRKFFEIITNKDDGVFYFHCSQGKDRAGLAAMFIELALGVDMKQIRMDYLMTQMAMDIRIEYLIEKVKERPYYDDKYRESLIDVFSAKEEYFERAIQTMTEVAGSPFDYVKNVLHADIDKLRELYLE